MLKLHTSNRLETLAESLAKTLRRPLRFLFQPELVMVQSQGMARWLKLQLAARHGICANYSFPFPKVFCAEVLAAHSEMQAGVRGNRNGDSRQMRASAPGPPTERGCRGPPAAIESLQRCAGVAASRQSAAIFGTARRISGALRRRRYVTLARSLVFRTS